MSETVCKACGRAEELRGGFCWDCCNSAELRAARRGVVGHVFDGLANDLRALWYALRWAWPDARNVFGYAQCDYRWAWQRLTQTGDYRLGGTFDREYPGWRRP